MNDKDKNSVSVKRQASASILGTFRGKVSSFNQHQIIGLIAILVLICIFSANLGSHSTVFVPLLKLSVAAFFLLMIAGFIRNCFIKPEDEAYPTSAKFMGMNKVLEVRNMPKSLVTKELLTAVASLIYPENEAPVGLIEGDVTDEKSIRKLTEEERVKLQEKERKDIQEHQRKVEQEVRSIQQSLPSEQAPKVDTKCHSQDPPKQAKI